MVPWVDGLTFGQVLATTVDRHGARDALVFCDRAYRWSYAEFRGEAREVARALLALGVQRGEHVGIWAANCPEWVLAQFATAHIGAVLVNINPAYKAHELAYILKQADLTTLLLTDRVKNSDFFQVLESVCPEQSTDPAGKLQSQAFPRLRNVVSVKEAKRSGGMWSWSEFRRLSERVSETDLAKREAEIRAEDVVNIQYTSGTTGFPKGAMLTHRNLLMNGYYVGQRLNFIHHDRLCIPVPFYHCFGCVMGTLMCVIYGAAMVIPAESFDPLATLQALESERCTAVYGVPTMFIAELHHAEFPRFDLKSLRTGIMAGSPCPIEVMRTVVDRMGARDLTIAYGLTEASPVITQTEAHDSLEHRVTTVGKPLPGLEVQIVRPGSRDQVPKVQQGELMVRGHGVMKGYYNKPTETAEVLTADGWLHTGDVALETSDGYYRITGRIKDVIIRGGENIYPREIEEFLYTHPQIEDVQVVGLPDKKYVEEASAWIRLKPGAQLTEDEVKAFCKSRIAHYKVPHYVAFIQEYPTTVTGKVQKFKLREMGIQRFGLHGSARIETA
jgi:fatty-acyl-CoA synthase